MSGIASLLYCFLGILLPGSLAKVFADRRMRQASNRISMQCRPMFPQNLSKLYADASPGPYNLTSCERQYVMDQGLAAGIAQMWIYKMGSENVDVLELGAGCGCYSDYFQWLGFRVQAFDGMPSAAALTHGIVRTADLSQPQTFEEVDWVMTLEVGEHIPKQSEHTFLSNVVRPAKTGVVLSWALPTGTEYHTNHPNPKHNDEVIDAMKRYGMHYDAIATERLRAQSGLSCCSYFKKTVLVFARQPNKWAINPNIRYGAIGGHIPRHRKTPY